MLLIKIAIAYRGKKIVNDRHFTTASTSDKEREEQGRSKGGASRNAKKEAKLLRHTFPNQGRRLPTRIVRKSILIG